MYLIEDRKRDGLFSGLSVLRNGSATALGGISRFGFVNPQRERRRVEPVLARLRVIAESVEGGGGTGGECVGARDRGSGCFAAFGGQAAPSSEGLMIHVRDVSAQQTYFSSCS